MRKKPIKEQGNVCRRHECIECCRDTKMPLTMEDVKRISRHYYPPSDFIVKAENEIRLKNVNGLCLFHTGKECKIYSIRPEGCRLYPLVFQEELKKAVIDTDCKH